MKYKVGDKVRCDGGDCWFYGTVSAVFEHSLSPCYRLNVERMEKKNCRLSITQFEFELEPRKDEEYSDKEENAEFDHLKKSSAVLDQNLVPIQEPVPEKKREPKQKTKPEKAELTQTNELSKRKISDAWEKNFDAYLKGERSYTVFNWITYNRKQYRTGKMPEEKFEKLKGINFSFEFDRKTKQKTGSTKPEVVILPIEEKKEKPERKKVDNWDKIFEAYCKGENSNLVTTWIAKNRKQYKMDQLPEDKFEKLIEINFPFDVVKAKKPDKWDKQLEEWKKGERKSIYVQRWRQRSIRQFLDGKLSADRIAKLKEVGILK
jgi:hypothetical protein